MSCDIALRADGLGKAYHRYTSGGQHLRDLVLRDVKAPEQWVLRDVSLALRRGEAVGIIGRNGAGKSTLLKIIAGTLQPSQGSVQVFGRVGTMLELGAGLHDDYTGRENARFAAAVMGLSPAQFDAVADDIERFADIGSYFDRDVREYSSGMYARLAFSVNIHCKPDILIVDEILSVGDIGFQLKCLEFLRGFCAQGGTLLFVSHDDAAVRALCDRAIWLEGGTVAAEGATDRVLRRYHTHIWKAQSGKDSFQVRDDAPAPAPPPAPDISAPASAGFNPDTLPRHLVAGAVTWVGFFDSRERQVPLVQGGQLVELRVRYHTDVALTQASVCFVLRNRMAQLLFGARTATLAQTAAGATHEARFRLMLPYLPSGEYSLEPMITAQIDGAAHCVLNAAPTLLPVQTVHISSGLANVRMRAVQVTREMVAVAQ
jgi:lipopolysaccharide transport system ATP-binding protein